MIAYQSQKRRNSEYYTAKADVHTHTHTHTHTHQKHHIYIYICTTHKYTQRVERKHISKEVAI
jgi:hypothetical protein